MTDLIDALPRQDRRLLLDMAADADTSPETLAGQMVREYLGLVRAVPEVLPNNPLRRQTSGHLRKRKA
jgi:hypothetical protein